MSKRSVEDGCEQQPAKKVSTTFLSHLIGPISTSKEMNIEVLKYQNKKLAQRIEQRKRCEAELRLRIDQLESRQMQDDSVLNVVNRYWNQFNEDIRVLLQRFDAETADELENKNESEVTTSFIMQLSTWDKEELDEKLANRVLVSKRAVAKLIQVFDRLMQRTDKISDILKVEKDDSKALDVSTLDEYLRQMNNDLIKENRNLQERNIEMHSKYNAMSLEISKYQDTLTGKETEEAELRHQIDSLQYELEKVRCRNDKLENHLSEAIEKLKDYQVHGNEIKPSLGKECTKPGGSIMTVAQQQHLEELKKELDEYKELANNRLAELDKLHEEHKKTLKEVDKLKMDIRQLPESVIVETNEYKCLQSHHSVLYNEFMQITTFLDETRQQLKTNRNEHLRQIEILESKELADQKSLRDELLQKQYVLDQTRKEFENLRNKYEQNIAANEQTAPINREMRHLITSLQDRNGQFFRDVQRYKRKYKDVSVENAKLRKEIEEISIKLSNSESTISPEVDIKNESTSSISDENMDKKDIQCDSIQPKLETELDANEFEDEDTKCDKAGIDSKKGIIGGVSGIKVESKESCKNEMVRDLRVQLKKSLNTQKEMKLLLDFYKSWPKEQRDQVELMASEKRKTAEIDELRLVIKKLQENQVPNTRKRIHDEEALRKIIKQLEDQKLDLQKQLTMQKNPDGKSFVGSNEEEALLNEMEVTGQAFDNIQEQNDRLIQQLSEKDEANFKLISERINANQKQILLSDQIEAVEQNAMLRKNQIEELVVVLRLLEEKEQILQNTIANLEKELSCKQRALEMHKRKTIELAQSADELKMHLEKHVAMMNEAQQSLAEKTSRLEDESYKKKRLQEELNQFKRKIEKMKTMEMTGSSMDEVMFHEIKEYQEILTCDSCKYKRKDAVLSKCFHVFCYDCLRTRYETRQRKCPKCNCAFGANDYHRLYLT